MRIKSHIPKTKKVGSRLEPTIIIRHGWEYHLVECWDRSPYELPQGNFMGFENMVLKSCKKVGEEIPIKKKKKYTRKRRIKI